MIKIARFFLIILIMQNYGCSKDDSINENPQEEVIEQEETITIDTPTFIDGQDPKPKGQAWKKVENLSDVFD